MQYKFQKDLEEALRHLKIADHMTYVTLPIVNEKRLLLKIFDEIYLCIICCINAILNYESLYKRIQLYKSFNDNLETFMNKCAKVYNLSNSQIKLIQEIVRIYKKHRESAMEFVKKDKVVIMSDNLNTQILNIDVIKAYLLLAKDIFMKTKSRLES